MATAAPLAAAAVLWRWAMLGNCPRIRSDSIGEKMPGTDLENTTVVAIRGWLEQLSQLENAKTCTAPQFLRPHHFVTLALRLAHRGASALELPSQLAGYAARMHLWRAIGIAGQATVNEHPTNGRFLPLKRLEDREQVTDLACELAELARISGCDAQTQEAVKVSMMEILGNCLSHGEVGHPLKALVCAQTWQQGNLAQIAIADAGIGVRGSLVGNPELHQRLAVTNACDLATELGVTSKPGKGHAGYGLALTRQLLERAGGRMILMSLGEWVQVHSQSSMSGSMPLPWQGTLLVLEWKLDQPMRLKDVYESWPPPEGFDNDDFDF
jgi:anti-sigma regulatory factor (Ser/Thr protein kinase)